MGIGRHTIELAWFFLILLGPLPLCAWLARLFRDDQGFASWLLSVGAFWCATQVFIGLSLGSLHLFGPHGIFVAETFVSVLGLVGIRLRGSQRPYASLLSIPRVFRELPESERVLLGFLGWVTVALFIKIATRPIGEFDSLSYHLPAMANWYQSGRFVMPEQWINQQSRYPYNWEVLCALFFAPFREDWLVAFPQLIAWGMFGLVIYCLATRFGAGRVPALGAASLALSVPLLVEQVYAAQVDLALAAFLLTAFFFSILAWQKPTLARLASCAAAFGLLAGTKTSGLIYSLIAAGGAGLMRMENSSASPGRNRKTESAAACGMIGIGLFVAAFWYVRNWFAFGNPLGIMAVRLGGFQLFDGSMELEQIRRTALSSVFYLNRLNDWSMFLSEMARGLYVPFFVLLLFAATTLTGYRTRQQALQARLIRLVIILGATAIAFSISPFSGDYSQEGGGMSQFTGQVFRYGFPFIGVLAVIASFAGGLFTTDLALVSVVLAISIMGLIRAELPYLSEFAVVVCAIGLLYRGLHGPLSRIRWRRMTGIAFGLIGCAGLVLGSLALRREREMRRSLVYGGIYEFIQNNTKANDIIGYSLSARSYLLYGKNWDRRVVYVPLNMATEDARNWTAQLARKGIGLVAIGPLPKWEMPRSPDLNWFNGDGSHLSRVFGDDWTKETLVFKLTV